MFLTPQGCQCPLLCGPGPFVLLLLLLPGNFLVWRNGPEASPALPFLSLDVKEGGPGL